MHEVMLHIRDVEGPKKTGSMETRLEAMEQQVFKCQGTMERGLNANHIMITEFTNKHRIDANDIGKHLSRLYDMIDQLQGHIYDLQNQNCITLRDEWWWALCGYSTVGGGGQCFRGNPRISSSKLDDSCTTVPVPPWEHHLWSNAGLQMQEVERLRLARTFGGAVRSCLIDTCYAESFLVGRCNARNFFQSLPVWTDDRWMVALLDAVVASMDVWTDKDDEGLCSEDGSVVR
ncbi:Serine/threonine-protein kinase HT1 [Hordeum vulgare]|nr:Serine/threonine-protein kinase HT1 [Hordeum vulgare]